MCVERLGITTSGPERSSAGCRTRHADDVDCTSAGNTPLTHITLRAWNDNRECTLKYHAPDSLGPAMEDRSTTAIQNDTARHWAGLRGTREGMDVVLLDSNGEAVEVMRVANDLQAVMRVIKRWRRTHGFDPSNAVFCVEEVHPFPTPVLELMLDRGWVIMVVGTDGASINGHSIPVTVAEVAGLAMRSALPLAPLSLTRLHAEKVDRLRQRREEMVALRNVLHADEHRNSRFEAELQREFERMDRRHVQLIDKLLSRLDTLINLQLRG